MLTYEHEDSDGDTLKIQLSPGSTMALLVATDDQHEVNVEIGASQLRTLATALVMFADIAEGK